MKFSPFLKCMTKFAIKLSSSNTGLLISKPASILDISRRSIHDITEDVNEGIAGNPTRVKEFLDRNGIGFQQGFTSITVGCQKCRHCTNTKAEQSKVYINTTTGGFVCGQCLWAGTWQKFETTVEAFRSGTPEELPKSKKKADSKPAELVDALTMAKEELELTQKVATLSDEEFSNLLTVHQVLGLERKTFEKFDVRVYSNKLDLFFPRYHLDKRKICGFKKVTVQQNAEETVITEKVYPREAGSSPGLFGWDLIPASATEVTLVSDEFDAMALHQVLKKPVLSLARGLGVLPVDSLPMFEQFTKLTIWLNGGSNRAWQTTKLFARKLIESRCLLVSPEIAHASPIAILGQSGDLAAIVKRAQPVTHKSIITFNNFRQEVYNELNNVGESNGTRWTRFPPLNRILKGHRKGELTVFTGPTGAGKTTFLSEYSLDLCGQGIRTLWGSFEIRNARLAKTMLNQFSQISLQRHADKFNYWADQFELLPLYFLAFHGQESMDNVLDAMRHAVYVHDIEHVIVDNLQFMMGSTSFKTFTDRIVRQDQMIEGFRRFASNYLCHVTVVMHPRKELESLSAQSIYGGVKASQEADNIMILQCTRGKSGLLQGRKYLEVVKNRFDGELGIMPLYFDKESQSFMRKDKLHRWSTVREQLLRDEESKVSPETKTNVSKLG